MTASKNIFWLSLSRAGALVLLFFAYTQLFRYLGPERAGQHQFVLSYITIFGVIIDFGIQQYIVKKVSETPSKAKHYFHQFFAVEVLLSTLIFISLSLVAWSMSLEKTVYHAIVWAGLGMCITGLNYPYLSIMLSFGELKKMAFLNFLSSFINAAIIVLTIYFKQNLVFLVSNQVIYACIAAILYRHFTRPYIGTLEVRGFMQYYNREDLIAILKATLPFALLVGFSTIYNRIDMILVKNILGYKAGGYYGAAYKMFDLLTFLPAAVSSALYPIFTRLLAQEKLSELRETFEKYLRFMLMIAVPIGVGGSILSREIVSIVAGREYVDSSSVALSILVWASSALYVYVVAHTIMVSRLTKLAVVATIINVAVNIVGNLLFLRMFNIATAAAMTVVSEVLQGALYFYFVRKYVTDFRLVSFVWRPLIAGVVMGLVVYRIHNAVPFIASIVVGGAVYFASLLTVRFFSREDLHFIKRFIKA